MTRTTFPASTARNSRRESHASIALTPESLARLVGTPAMPGLRGRGSVSMYMMTADPGDGLNEELESGSGKAPDTVNEPEYVA